MLEVIVILSTCVLFRFFIDWRGIDRKIRLSKIRIRKYLINIKASIKDWYTEHIADREENIWKNI